MNRHSRLFAVLCITLMLTLGFLFAPLTSLAAENGVHYIFSMCDTSYGDDSAYCYTDIGVYVDRTTPSGNHIFTSNGQSSFSFTDPSGNVIYSGSSKYHGHYVETAVMTKEYGAHSIFVFSYGGQTCTTYGAYHYVGNNLQIDRYEVSCI
jgi:hypothetical protein